MDKPFFDENINHIGRMPRARDVFPNKMHLSSSEYCDGRTVVMLRGLKNTGNASLMRLATPMHGDMRYALHAAEQRILQVSSELIPVTTGYPLGVSAGSCVIGHDGRINNNILFNTNVLRWLRKNLKRSARLSARLRTLEGCDLLSASPTANTRLELHDKQGMVAFLVPMIAGKKEARK